MIKILLYGTLGIILAKAGVNIVDDTLMYCLIVLNVAAIDILSKLKYD